jgi:hypothetical protein
MTNRTRTILTSTGTTAAMIAVVLVTWLLSSSYLDQSYASSHHGCLPPPIIHKVIIHNNNVTPSNIVGLKCDALTITNGDDIQRLIAFGPHEHHVAYDGITEHMLMKNQSLTVTLVQVGSFRFHDHIHDEVQGTFTVKQPPLNG